MPLMATVYPAVPRFHWPFVTVMKPSSPETVFSYPPAMTL
jgi:hypothetical protein